MLKIVVPAWEDWDPVNSKFINGRETTLTLEHSLVSISKWESKFHKPFLKDEQKTDEEMLYYIKCMTITNPNKDVSDEVYQHLTLDNIKAIDAYIGDPMTATTINRRNQKTGRKEIITSEVIYYWMTALNIPFECQRWHLNRLMTLIEVAGIKNQPSKKMSKKDMAAQNRSLNAARRAKYNTKG